MNQLKRCHCFARRTVDSRTTIIDTFATFFLLSYTKLLYTSIYFLLYSQVEKNGLPFKVVFGLDPSSEYFSKSHAPFAFFAILILIGPVFLPVVLLTLYPVRAFRTILEKCRVSGHSRAAVNLFVEKFYSCYRDGLTGGKDMRSFVFLQFFLRYSILIGVVLQSFVRYGFSHFLLFGGASLLVALVKPYKHVYMNVIDSLILAVLSLTGILYILYFNSDETHRITFFFIALCVNFMLPLLGFTVAVSTKIIMTVLPGHWREKLTQFFGKRFLKDRGSSSDEINVQMQENQHISTSVVITTDIEFPDRVLRPEAYANSDSADDHF